MRTVLALASFALLGCGSGFHPVKGRIHYSDGSPVTHGRIVLDMPGSAGAWGLIRPDGAFTIGTNSPDDGLPAGIYKAYLQNTETFPPAGHSGNFVPKQLVHPRHTNPETSGLSLEVPKVREWDVLVDRP